MSNLANRLRIWVDKHIDLTPNVEETEENADEFKPINKVSFYCFRPTKLRDILKNPIHDHIETVELNGLWCVYWPELKPLLQTPFVEGSLLKVFKIHYDQFDHTLVIVVKAIDTVHGRYLNTDQRSTSIKYDGSIEKKKDIYRLWLFHGQS